MSQSARPNCHSTGNILANADDSGVLGRLVYQASILFLVTLLVYWPSYRAGFIWDDDAMLENPLVRGGWAGLRDIWFTTKLVDYWPLTSTTFWLEWQLWGDARVTQHTVNILLHAFNVVLLWRVLLHVFPSTRIQNPESTIQPSVFSASAWWAALLFAVHPVCVASVTWVAERKNVLSMFFYLLSLLLYLRHDDARLSNQNAGIRNQKSESFSFYWASLFAFVLGLCSKTSIVVLPIVLLLHAWWCRDAITRQDILRIAPFFCVAFVFGLITIAMQHSYVAGRIVELSKDSPLVRSMGASWAVWFYLGKDLLPIHLTMHYPKWAIDPASPMAYLPGFAIVILFGVFWRFRRTWGRSCLFGFGYFVVALSPTLGVLNMAYLTLSRVADHFQYLALPGLMALVVSGLALLFQKASRCSTSTFSLQPLAFGLLVLPLAILSWRYQRVVGNPEALWRDNLKKIPNSWPARNNLGLILIGQGKYQEAEAQCRAAVAIDPKVFDSYYNLGNALSYQNKFDDAIRAYAEAAHLAPGNSRIHNNLGHALAQAGRTNEAVTSIREAVRLDPNNVEACNNLARLLTLSNRPDEAVEQYRAAVRLQPANAVFRQNLGNLLSARGRLEEALTHLREAVRLAPDSADAQANFGSALLQKGRAAEAVIHCSKAVRLQPEHVVGHTGLGNAFSKLGKTAEAGDEYALAHYFLARELVQQGKLEEAKEHYQQAIQLRPSFVEAYYEFGDLLHRQNLAAEALRSWRRALELKPDWLELLNNLAWLLATSPDEKLRNGSEAITLAERACKLADSNQSSFLDTLAAAYAEAGRFDDAINTQQRAVDSAAKAGEKQMADRRHQRLKIYQSHQPYHESK